MRPTRTRDVGIASGLAALAVAVLFGCSGDPSVLLDGRGVDARRTQSPTEPAGAEAQGGAAPIDDASAEVADSSSPDGGIKDAQVDAADADAGPLANAFTGAGAFVPTTGPSARRPAHAFAGNTPPTSPAKQACLGCHVAGGAAPAFAFGGTAFKDLAATIPAAGVEIRVRAADGTTSTAYTDEDGNFYQAVPFTFPANAGVRSATATRLMTAAVPNGNCGTSQCHDGAAHPFINLP